MNRALLLSLLVLASPMPAAARPPSPAASARAPGGSVDANTYTHGPIGLTLHKPDAWFFLGDAAVLANRERAHWSTEAWTKAIRSGARLPLMTISMNHDPSQHHGITPTVGLVASPVPVATTPDELLTAILPMMQQAMADLVVEAPVVSSTLGGEPAARLVVTYTLRGNVSEFRVRSEYVTVIREGVALTFAFAGPAETSDHQDAFQAIAQSVRWDAR